jgi:hypothetical protein
LLRDLIKLIALEDVLSGGGLTVARIVAREPSHHTYIGLDAGVCHGVQLSEVGGVARISEIVVENPAAADLLITPGEIALGGFCDRIISHPVLVPGGGAAIAMSFAGAPLPEAGDEVLSVSAYGTPPSVQRLIAHHITANSGWHFEIQDLVDRGIDDLRMRSDHTTDARGLHALLAAQTTHIASQMGAFPLANDQCGVIFGLCGVPVAMHVVSRPEVFAEIYPKLLAGALIDALADPDGPSMSSGVVSVFVDEVIRSAPTDVADGQLGTCFILGHDDGIVGNGLIREEELVCLSAFGSGID